MMRIYFALILFSFVLTGCKTALQPASQAWDEPKPQLFYQAQAPKKSVPVKHVSTPPVPKTSKTSLNKQWRVEPPALNTGAQILELPVKPGDQMPQGLFEWPTGLSRDAQVIELAKQYLGVPYKFGGETPQEGFDCSGLVQYVFSLRGVALTRLANEQFLQGQFVSKAELQPGDLVFFNISGKGVDHVGIYAGEAQFIHAPRTGRVVSYDRLDSPYFTRYYQGARRVST
jgi:cell wall-associated NlpC family hydrolase